MIALGQAPQDNQGHRPEPIIFMSTPSRLIPEKLQRCSWLFLSLLSLITMLPLLHHMPYGLTVLRVLQWCILLTAIMAIGRSRHSLMLGLLFITLSLSLYAVYLNSRDLSFLFLSRIFSMAVYAITISTLLRYVLLQETMDSDRLYGAASIYLMLGILWSFLYGILLERNPEAISNLALNPDQPIMDTINIVYFSFTTLTTTGYGDIAPISPAARILASIEQIVGTLFIAILIARLVGFYSPHNR